jgi:hypothetical protein
VRPAARDGPDGRPPDRGRQLGGALCTFTGTTHDGRKIAITGSIHARIVGGRILEAYNHFDFLGLFAQLGLLPPDVLGRCLSGRPGCP